MTAVATRRKARRRRRQTSRSNVVNRHTRNAPALASSAASARLCLLDGQELYALLCTHSPHSLSLAVPPHVPLQSAGLDGGQGVLARASGAAAPKQMAITMAIATSPRARLASMLASAVSASRAASWFIVAAGGEWVASRGGSRCSVAHVTPSPTGPRLHNPEHTPIRYTSIAVALRVQEAHLSHGSRIRSVALGSCLHERDVPGVRPCAGHGRRPCSFAHVVCVVCRWTPRHWYVAPSVLSAGLRVRAQSLLLDALEGLT